MNRFTTVITCMVAGGIFLMPSATAQAEQKSAPAGKDLTRKERKYELMRDMPLFLDSLKTELSYPMAWGNSDITDFDLWKTTARARMTEEMLPPPPKAESYDMVIVESEKRDGYTAHKIEFNLTKYSRVGAYLLVPDGEGPFPGIVALHDHGAHYTIGKEKMVRPFGVDKEILDDALAWADNLYEQQFVGDYLANNGYVVLSTDALLWGERGCKEGSDNNHLASVAGNFLLVGRNLSAWMTYEDMLATEFLATLPETDPERLGCVGLSMGGYRSWMLAAMSPLIKASVAVCWMTTTDAMMHWTYGRHERGGYANNLGGVHNYLDYPHIASMACPNALMLVNGETDKLFKPHAVKECYDIIRRVYECRDASDKFECHLLPQGHEMPKTVQKSTLDFFDKHLNSNGKH